MHALHAPRSAQLQAAAVRLAGLSADASPAEADAAAAAAAEARAPCSCAERGTWQLGTAPAGCAARPLVRAQPAARASAAGAAGDSQTCFRDLRPLAWLVCVCVWAGSAGGGASSAGRGCCTIHSSRRRPSHCCKCNTTTSLKPVACSVSQLRLLLGGTWDRPQPMTPTQYLRCTTGAEPPPPSCFTRLRLVCAAPGRTQSPSS